MYQLKRFFITTKMLIKDAIKEWNIMEWLAERIKIR